MSRERDGVVCEALAIDIGLGIGWLMAGVVRGF